VNANPAGTAFCLQAGAHNVISAVTPKTGDSFTGAFGAIVDASGWSTTDTTQGVFRARNQNIDDVTIRNLVIRNCPGAVNAYRDHSDGWIIDHNEIVGCRSGIQHGNFFSIHHNYIHHNWQYGISGYRSTGSLIEENEFAFNAARRAEFPGDSANSKWAMVTNTTVRGNYVHDNNGNGIWFDGWHSGILIEDNVVRNNVGNGIFSEIGGQTVIRNNVVAGSHRGIYISESHDTEIYGNRIESTDRAVALFQDGNRISENDLYNNFIHDNTFRVPVTGILAAPMATALTCSNLTSTQCASYSTSRGNRFEGNEYHVSTVGNRSWYWKNASKTWTEWQAEGQDLTGKLHVL
jgi:parallel beta-helix repeat protein